MTYFHVRITPKSDPSNIEVELDLSLEKLTRRFIDPYNKGTPIVIDGRAIASEDVGRIQINKTDQDSAYLNAATLEQYRARRIVVGIDPRGRLRADLLADNGEDVTDEFITGPPGSESESASHSSQEVRPATGTRDVFVVHGRNTEARDALFEFLRAIDLHPLEWSEAVRATGKPSPYIGEILDAAFSRAHAVVVLFTPDDEARLREQFRIDSDLLHETQLTGQARPNVLFEAGMAMGRSQDRTVLVELGDLRPFSDVAGRHAIRLANNSQRRQELAQRLEAAGCPVNLQGTDWHTAGDFEAALALLTQGLSEPMAVEEQPSNNAAYPQLSDDAKELLIDAANSAKGAIVRVRSAGGLVIQAGGKSFVESGDKRSEARWNGALEELLNYGLVNDPTGKGQLFDVTREGFEVADELGASE